ncbi:hypothetical protein HDU96_003010, partial [Phlyctochytrium bullatum]
HLQDNYFNGTAPIPDNEKPGNMLSIQGNCFSNVEHPRQYRNTTMKSTAACRAFNGDTQAPVFTPSVPGLPPTRGPAPTATGLPGRCPPPRSRIDALLAVLLMAAFVVGSVVVMAVCWCYRRWRPGPPRVAIPMPLARDRGVGEWKRIEDFEGKDVE